MKVPGSPFIGYGQPSWLEDQVVRAIPAPPNPATQGVGAARTPLHLLDGMITPSGLHFERSHSGIPDIDPDRHRLVIHGLVRRPLVFTLEALSRYPMQSRIAFIECGGNSAALNAPQAQRLGMAAIHGLLGCSEWTGVRLSTLLDEAGVEPSARWLIAEGADSAALSRSIPLAKAMDDALVCLYQNGERVRPSNGYPVRLLLPGFEGIMNVKWLRRIKLVNEPAMTKDETSKYTILLKDEKAWQFVLPMEVKSIITRPAPGLALKGPDLYQISVSRGLATAASDRSMCRPMADEVPAPAALQDPIRPRRCASAQRGMERRSGNLAKPGHRRYRHGATDPRPVRSRAWLAWRLPLQCGSQAGASMRRGRPPMFMLERLAVCAAISVVAPALAQAPQFDNRSHPPTSRPGISASRPDGAGLPLGRGTAGQGEAVYAAKCQACHGEKGLGRPNDALVGGMGSLAPDNVPVKTVGSYWPYATTLFDYIRRAMPFQESQSLTSDEVYAVSAYILNLNGIIGANEVLDAQSLPKVRMPNRDGFILFPRNPK
jgi:sulfane dehydrogenase subunit SoxC